MIWDLGKFRNVFVGAGALEVGSGPGGIQDSSVGFGFYELEVFHVGFGS